jgi:hypothetical protein
MVLTKHSRVSFYRSLYPVMPRKLNTPLHLFADLGARSLDWGIGFPLLWLVLATGPGNLPVDRFFAGGSIRIGSKPGQKPEPHSLGGVVTRTAVPLSGSFNFRSN